MTTPMNYPFTIELYPSPGDTIVETIESLGISKSELALRTGLTLKSISLLVNGKTNITPNIADKLEYVTDVPSNFWLTLENNYRRHLKRYQERQEAELSAARSFVHGFPYSALVKKGYCIKTSDPATKKDALLRFFAVSGESEFATTYLAPIEGAARVGASQSWNAKSFSAWLRLTELAAQKVQTSPFNIEKLKEAIPEIRLYVTQQPSEVWDKVQNILAKAGVAAVIEEELPGTHVFGFSRFPEPTKAVVALTLRGKRLGAFWFNLFHELAHLLFHGKKKRFLNIDDSLGGKCKDAKNDNEERHASEFSRNLLIHDDWWRQFIASNKSFSGSVIHQFAKDVNVSSDYVLARLQGNGLVSYDDYKLNKSCRQSLM